VADVLRTIYDKLWDMAVRDDWREYIALATGGFVIAMVLIRSRRRIWKRMQTIETQLSKMQNEISAILQVQAALITKLSINSKADIDPGGTTVEIGSGDVAGQTMSRPTTSPQPESAKS
jgi:hypothetical protein